MTKIQVENRPQIQLFLLLTVICLIWGVTFSIMKAGLQYMPAVTFTGLRYFFGGISLALIAIAMGTPLPAKKDWGALLLLGILQTTLTYGLVFYGLQWVEAGVTSVMLYSYPLIVNILAHYLLPNEKLNLQRIFGLIVGFSGLIIIFGTGGFSSSDKWSMAGKLLITVGAFFWAVATIYLRRRFPNHNKLVVTAWQMLLGGAVTLIGAFIIENGQDIVFNQVSVGALAFTSILSSALAFAIWFYLLDHIDAGRASVFLFLVPVFGVIFANLILGEPFTAKLMIGLIAVVVGIVLVNYRVKKKEAAADKKGIRVS